MRTKPGSAAFTVRPVPAFAAAEPGGEHPEGLLGLAVGLRTVVRSPAEHEIGEVVVPDDGRNDVDHAGVPHRAQGSHQQLDQQARSEHVGGERKLDASVRLTSVREPRACVVDEQVQPARACRHLRRKCPDGGCLGDVDRQRDHGSVRQLVRGGDLLRGGLTTLHGARSDHDGGPHGGQPASDLHADAARRPGDHGNAASAFSVHRDGSQRRRYRTIKGAAVPSIGVPVVGPAGHNDGARPRSARTPCCRKRGDSGRRISGGPVSPLRSSGPC